MSRSDALKAVEAELEAAGVEYTVERGKHAKVRFQSGGRSYMYTVAVTCGGGNRAVPNSRAGIRRLMRQLGLLDGRPATGDSYPRKGARHEQQQNMGA